MQRGSGVCTFKTMVKNGAFWSIFLPDVFLKYFQKFPFLIKTNAFICTIAMEYYAARENFENMPQMMHFNVYFDKICVKK